MVFDKYLNLSAKEQRFVAFLAFAGTWSRKSMPPQYVGFVGSVDLRDCISSVVRAGLVSSSYFFDLEIVPEEFFRAKAFARRYWPEIVNQCETDYLKTRMMSNAVFHKVEYFLYHKKPSELKKLKIFSGNVARLFKPVLLEPGYEPLIELLPDETVVGIAIDELTACLENDSVDSAQWVLSFGDKIKDSVSAAQYIQYQDFVRLFRYLSHGVFPSTETFTQKRGETPIKERPYLLTLMGIKAMNIGGYADAMDYFLAALKVLNREASLKNVFRISILNYYLILSYAHVGTDAAINKARQFLNKRDISEYKYTKAGCLLAEAFTSRNFDFPDYMLRRLNDSTVLSLKLGQLFAFYFNKSTKYIHPTASPKSAVLRFEMQDCINLNENEKSVLTERFGAFPALTSIRHIEPWELTLNDIETIVGDGDKDNAESTAISEPAARVIYKFTPSARGYMPYMNINIQTRLKSGKWSVPKALTRKAFSQVPDDCLTETDRVLCTRYLDQYMSPINASDIIPDLIGCDRVYSNSMQRVEIVNENPRLIIDKDKNGNYVFSSNIPNDFFNDRNFGSKLTIQQSLLRYAVVTFSPEQWKILDRLLDSPPIPPKAEERMRRIATRICTRMEVHSPLIEDEETISGGATLCLQLAPDQWSFNLRIMSAPYQASAIRCVPCTGEKSVFDVIDGKRVRIKRDFKAERNAVNALAEYFEDTTGSSLRTDGSGLDLKQTLTVLDYATSHPEDCIIEWPRGESLRLLTPPASAKWNVNMRASGGWFDLEGDVQISEDRVISISRMLRLLAESNSEYIRLGENEYLKLDAGIRRQLQRIEAASADDHGQARIAAVNAAVLTDEAFDGPMRIETDETLRALRERVRTSFSEKPKVPGALKATLRDYQTEGYRWISRLASWGAGACLADDMGLGKTVQAIAFLLSKSQEGPSLIVAPASVIPNWKNELSRFSPSLNVTVFNTVPDRQAAVTDAGAGDVMLITYGVLHTAREILEKKQWCVACLDEAHTIKNRDTAMSRGAMAIQSTYRLILTGTPIQNSLSELWNLFRFINPTVLGSYESFSRRFITPIEAADDKDCRRQLQRLIRPFILRRTKEEVVEELPEKMDITVPVELSEHEMAVYESLRRQAVEQIESATSKSMDVSILAEITRLRRCACDPALVDKSMSGESSKTRLFIDMVKEMSVSGRMLVFSQFTSYLEMVRHALDEEKIPYLYLDGSTPIKKRGELVAEFQNGDTPLFLISLKAGGLGLNLTGANYVMHLDPWWNPAIEQQATDRAYRIGQTRNVTVYHLISQHTIEEKIVRLHADKRRLAEDILEGTGTSARLTRKELLELLNENV